MAKKQVCWNVTFAAENRALRRKQAERAQATAERLAERDRLYAAWLDKAGPPPLPETTSQPPQLPRIAEPVRSAFGDVVVKSLDGEVLRIDPPNRQWRDKAAPRTECSRNHDITPDWAGITRGTLRECKACEYARSTPGLTAEDRELKAHQRYEYLRDKAAQ